MFLFPVLHHAHNFYVELDVVPRAHGQVYPDGVSLRKELFLHGLIDDRHFRARGRISSVEFASGQQRHSHGRKIIWAHRVIIHMPVVGIQVLTALHRDVCSHIGPDQYWNLR